MYSIALCDDDIGFCEEFEKKLSALLNGKDVRFRFASFNSASKLLEAFEGGKRFDLVFLDVMLNDSNGIDVARTIRENRYTCEIIFISSYRDYAFDSYEVHPLHYLEKSPGTVRLEDAIDRFLEKSSGSTLYLTNSRGAFAVNLNEILYFEVIGHELIIHMVNGAKSRHRISLSDMEDMLPVTSFVRIQRSYLVNLEYVKEINRHEAILSNGESVPMGRGMYDAIRLKFLDYVAKKNSF